MAKLVIIGGVAAGMSAAAKARRTKKDIEIEVYTDEEYISYSGCGLPYYVQGFVAQADALVARDKASFLEQGIKVFTGYKVEGINAGDHRISLREPDGKLREVSYDKLIIATGAAPVVPDFYRPDLQNVYFVKRIPDVIGIRQILERGEIKSAVIVGGGYIGLEMAEALARWQVKLTIVQLTDSLLNTVEPDMSRLIEQHLREKGVEVRTSERVLALEGKTAVQRVVTDKGVIPADLVIVAVGVVPNSRLAEEAGIALGVLKAIKVYSFMETSVPDIYAAGDCAVHYHLVTKQDAYIPLGTTANKQGRVAGENAVGGHAEFKGIVGTAIVKVMDLEVARTGVGLAEARNLGWQVKEIDVQDVTKAGFCPATAEIAIKLLVNEADSKIIGAQIVGGSGAGKRIDVLAAAVQMGLTPKQLAELDLSYAPPFSPVWDPVLVAANVAAARLERDK